MISGFKNICFAVAFLTASQSGASKPVFETSGSDLSGWNVQWHETDHLTNTAPVWVSDGERIKGEPFRSDYRDADLGGTMFNTNAVQLAVGDYAVFKMVFEAKGITSPDNLNHWWFSFGLRTGGESPWIHGDLGAYASVLSGSGPEQYAGFSFWNMRSDSWTEPYPHCAVPSDDRYIGGPLTVTFYVQRTEEGFGPSTIITSNHVNGIEQAAVGLINQANHNNCAAEPLYFFLRLPAEFDETGGFSTLGSYVRVSNLSLEVRRSPPISEARLGELARKPAYGGEPEAVIKRIFDIKRLTNEEAAKKVPVIIEAQVLNLHPRQTRLFVHDDQAGMYVELARPAAEYTDLRAGSLVELRGTTESGGYSPVLLASSLRVTGQRALPEAMRLSRTLTRSTNFDVDWVQVTGRPVSMEFIKSYGHYLIKLETSRGFGNEQIEIFVPYEQGAFERMKRFMFRPVSFSGVLATKANQMKQMTGRVLYINSVDDFSLVSDFLGSVPRFYSIDELMQYGKETFALVKTKGVVTGGSEDALYLRGNGCSLRVSIFREQPFQKGDLVELVGYVELKPVSPSFQAVSIQCLEHGRTVRPFTVSLENSRIDSGWNYDLIALDAEFVYAEKRLFPGDGGTDQLPEVQTLWCRAGGRLVEARFPGDVPLPEGLRPGSLVKLTGIGHVSETKNPRIENMTAALWLELSGEAGIEIIRKAPWWTAQRLLWGIIIVSGILFLMVVWVFSLRKVVAAQTSTIGKQIKRESVLNERQRIARELHDTLEQGLTALSLQLGRLLNKIRKSSPEDLPVVEKAVNALRVCQEESRASIKDLRDGMLEKVDLPAAVKQTLISRLDEDAPKLQFRLVGKVVRLSLFVEHQLVRIITEAAVNAAHHASPQRISVSMKYGEATFTAVVEDDGCGFDPEAIAETGRYGVLGMQERARRISGHLTMESEPGKGTRVELTVRTDASHLESRYE
ncbi:sensor histidine kinase [Pontiella agarivorans]|uniref:Sensor histidine kinase n=1 Tax=Pontiella agarivorans TaxID=3038953 RepID=A0ABU5MU92_9BACT|nr:sensor histidine kinase [Pontiella agarivorans]MDZ8117799.1 sensor histidine kinase [Pontiella agarivorans]